MIGTEIRKQIIKFGILVALITLFIGAGIYLGAIGIQKLFPNTPNVVNPSNGNTTPSQIQDNAKDDVIKDKENVDKTIDDIENIVDKIDDINDTSKDLIESNTTEERLTFLQSEGVINARSKKVE